MNMRIYTVPSYILTKKTKEVIDFGNEFQFLVDRMIATMRFALGVGLAAPQIGKSIKLFVVEYEVIEKEIIKTYVVANPKVEWRSFDSEYETEGCLSIPEFRGNIERSKSIGISGLDRYGENIYIESSGYLARIFQHEIDHLNGILIS